VPVAKLIVTVRHVALMEVHGKDYRLTPIPLRTVRPFVLDEVILSDAAEDEGFDLNDRMAISKFLRAKVPETPVYHTDRYSDIFIDKRND
jgi:hypothetical protein